MSFAAIAATPLVVPLPDAATAVPGTLPDASLELPVADDAFALASQHPAPSIILPPSTPRRAPTGQALAAGKRRFTGVIDAAAGTAAIPTAGALYFSGATDAPTAQTPTQEASSRYFSKIASAPWALFTDMDGTLFTPNEAPTAASLASWERILRVLRGEGVRIPLVYVTGRSSLAGILETQRQYGTAEPDIIAAAVGSTIYAKEPESGQWVELMPWQQLLGAEWPEREPINRILMTGTPPEINSPAEMALRRDFVGLLLEGPFAAVAQKILSLPGGELQKATSQRDFRRSFFADVSLDEAEVQQQINATLCTLAGSSSPGCEAALPMEEVHRRLGYRVVVSKDRQHVLIDVLPASGTKSGAMTFLADALALSPERIFYSGDTRNDLDALMWSGLPTFVGTGRDAFAEWLGAHAAELRGPGQLPIYLSPLPQIFGVEDGLRHFGLMRRH